MRAAIERNDTRVTALFLQGGMNWQLAWTEQAFAAEHTEVLQLLLRYPALMDEVKPCRRFITTLSHDMSSGAPLTAMHKNLFANVLHRSGCCDAPAARYGAGPTARSGPAQRRQ